MSDASFFFYDLETSGFDARNARIMQFAGQRTDMDLQPVGEPIDVKIRLTPDTLPDPDAVLVTGITPQMTITDGISEAEFMKLFYEEVVRPDTTFLGFNTIRFDDEFMRFLHYRNFYDAYEWQWKDGCSRWDLLDLVRMTRALRPEGIVWPFSREGKPTNRLEFLTAVNKLDHAQAHDALSDVQATIAVARLIKENQADLFRFSFEHRKKDKVKEVVDAHKPFVYTSGRYGSEWLHTTAAVKLMPHPAEEGSALVYDLRFDPTPFLTKSAAELVEHWRYSKDPQHVRLPLKTLKYNRCPAVAPLNVWNAEVEKRLHLSMSDIMKHLDILKAGQKEFAKKLAEAVKLMNEERAAQQTEMLPDDLTVDGRLYDGFFGPKDKVAMAMVRAAAPEELGTLKLDADERLRQLLPLYKARNYPQLLSSDERGAWDSFCQRRLQGGGPNSRLQKFAQRLQALGSDPKLTAEKRYLLEELQLYAESILIVEEAD